MLDIPSRKFHLMNKNTTIFTGKLFRAVAWRGDSMLYFVVETKSTGTASLHLDVLRPLEQLKMECGKGHFRNFQQVQFKVVTRLHALLN